MWTVVEKTSLCFLTRQKPQNTFVFALTGSVGPGHGVETAEEQLTELAAIVVVYKQKNPQVPGGMLRALRVLNAEFDFKLNSTASNPVCPDRGNAS